MAQRYATVDDLEVLDAGVSALASDTVSEALAAAENLVDVPLWRDKASHAHARLALHLLALTTGALGGEKGPVTSRSVGALSTSYAAAPFGDDALGSTRWGRAFLMLRAAVPVVGVAV